MEYIIIKKEVRKTEDRIKELRKYLKLSRDDFAIKLGLSSRGKIQNIETGKVKPDDAFIKLICKTYNVNYDWLVYGEGDMFKKESAIKEIVRSIVPDDEFAINTMAAAAEMPVEWWHDMARLVNELVQKMNEQK